MSAETRRHSPITHRPRKHTDARRYLEKLTTMRDVTGFLQASQISTKPIMVMACAFGDARPGAYCHRFDIMSAMNVQGYLMARFLAPSRDSTQMVPSTYTIEFKEPVDSDRDFCITTLFIHEIRTDGLVRSLTNSHGGLLDLNPSSEFVAPNASVVVRLLGVDPATHTATLRITALPPRWESIGGVLTSDPAATLKRREGWWCSRAVWTMRSGIPRRTRSTGTGRVVRRRPYIRMVVLTCSHWARTTRSGRDGKQPLMATGYIDQPGRKGDEEVRGQWFTL
jgi:hypothetical protein